MGTTLPGRATSVSATGAPEHRADRLASSVSLAAVALLFAALTVQKIWNLDLWWQMRTGRWILEHRSVPDRGSSCGGCSA